MEEPTNNLKPKTAPLSFCVAIIPNSPLKEQVASASLAITQKFDNKNIIDNKKFPAHISLYLGGTDLKFIPSLIQRLKTATTQFFSFKYLATQFYKGSRGFIGLNCGYDALSPVIQTVLLNCALLHKQNPLYRPHIVERWLYLPQIKKQLLKKYGTYKVGTEIKPHFSIAQVPEINLDDAFNIAIEYIALPKDFKIESFQFVDIGHKNEKWNVLAEWPFNL